jgi:hypothetical protein
MTYLMEHSGDRASDLWLAENVSNYVQIHCPIDPGHRSALRASNATVFREAPPPETRVKLTDVLYVSEFASFLLQAEVEWALAVAGIPGFPPQPATVLTRNGDVVTSYRELQVDALAHIASPSAGCEIEWRCRGCNMREYHAGLRVDLAVAEARPTTDFFVIWPLARYVFCSERAKSILQRFESPAIRFVDPATLTEPLEFFGDAEIPHYFSATASARIDAFWAAAPLWPYSVSVISALRDRARTGVGP